MLICFEYFRAHLKWGPKIFSELTIVATVVNQIEHKNCSVLKGFHKWSVLGLTICDSEFFSFTFQWFISYISLHRQL